MIVLKTKKLIDMVEHLTLSLMSTTRILPANGNLV